MSIASELQNYADGLDNAYDAAQDMGATIPVDRNMDNLDDAIRTIPVSSPNDGVLTITQNGSPLGTFSANQSTNTTVNITGGATKLNLSWTGSDMLDVDTQTSVTGTTVLNGMASGTVEVTDISAADEPSGVITSSAMLSTWHDEIYGDLTDVTYFSTVFTVRGNTTKSITYLYSTAHGWLYPVTYNIQKELTAGTNIAIAADGTISATDTTYSDMTGATSSVAGAHGLVPAPAAGDQSKVLHGDGTWKDATAKLVEMAYGESNAWAKFIAAYNAGSIVYCRASSNSNPASGSQTRKAFMAYVNNAANPTNVEFQYVRSASSKTDSQQTDQVFVYTLTNASGGTWSVASRNMGPKINVSGPITKTFSNGANATITIGADAMTGATSGTAGAAGVVPKPNSGDQDKVLTGAGTWANVTGPNMDFSSAAGTAVIKTVTDALDRTGIYFADGTLITTRKAQYVGPINTSWGSLYEGHTNDYYKFAPTGGDDFVAEPNVQVTIFNNSASGSCWLGAWENSPQIVSGGWAIPAGALCFIRASAFPTDVTLNLYIQAIGRWK